MSPIRILIVLVFVSSCSSSTSGNTGGGGGTGSGGSGVGGGAAGGTGGSGGGAAGGSGGGSGGGTAGGSGGGTTGCGWDRAIASTSNDTAYDVVAMPDQSVVVVGFAGQAIPDAGLARGGFAARLDQNGNTMWAQSLGLTANPREVKLAGDGSLLLSGFATSDAGCSNFHGASGVRDVWFARVNAATGSVTQNLCIGGDDDDEAFAVREVAFSDGGTAIHITGSTDSHNNGDIGPKKGGGGFNAPDMLNAFLFEGAGGPTVRASCQGTLGPDEGRGFLDDGSLVGNTFGANDGDLLNETVPPGFNDLIVARFAGGVPCVAQSCPVTASRIAGNLGDSIYGALPGNVVYGVTRSNDGGISCPGATQTTATPFVATWAVTGLTALKCLTSSGNTRVDNGFATANAIWVVGSGAGSDGVFAGSPIAGTGTNPTNFVIGVDLATHQTVTRAVRINSDLIYSAAMRPDGCLVVVGNDKNDARVLTVPP